MASKKSIAEHEATAQTHGELMDSCANLEECFGSMGKAAGADGEMFHKASAHFGDMKKTHAVAKAFHEDCAKSEDDELGKTWQSDKLSSVARIEAPVDEPFGIRKVIRPGQPEQPVDTTDVPIEFKHLLSNEGD